MKILKIILTLTIMHSMVQVIFAQSYSDTIKAKEYCSFGDKFYGVNTDSSTFYYLKAAEAYKQIAEKNNDSLLWAKHVKYMYYVSWNLNIQSKYSRSIKILNTALDICIKHIGKEDKATAGIYYGLGNVYYEKTEFDLALKNFIKSKQIYIKLFGEKHEQIAFCYNSIGNVYREKKEYELALQYYLNSLQTAIDKIDENNNDIALIYNNIGVVYTLMNKYDLSIKYHLKALKIRIELFGESDINTAITYNNIGAVYAEKNETKLALEYEFKALKIYKELLGENNLFVAKTLTNIGNCYSAENKFDKDLMFQLKALQIIKSLIKHKDTHLAMSYNNVGGAYAALSEYDSAIKYYQKGTASNLRNFNDTANIDAVPVIKDYLDWNELLKSLEAKAEIFVTLSEVENPDSGLDSLQQKPLSGFETADRAGRLKLALHDYQACDTLISQVRKNMKTKSDKIALGTIASEVYKGAIDVCLDLANAVETDLRLSHSRKNKQETDAGLSLREIRELAFYFSEKNKSSVLLESLAGAEAQKFAEIPDTLLQQEHKLQIDIAFYKKVLAEGSDSIKEVRFNNKLFKANRSYDSLIVVFENNYPEYYNLKYNQKPVSVEQIQNMLDKRTALISYFTGDSTITIFMLTKKKFDIMQVDKPEGFEDKISDLRENISNTNFLADDYKNNTHITADIYQKNAFELYNMLLPKEVKDILGKKTENLIIIPDGRLATLPFEALLTQKYTTTWTDWKNKQYFFEMPYLVKDFNISYTYSANLFYKTFNKTDKQKELEITDLNDWLAFAPVFDNENISGTSMRTRKLLNKITGTNSDTIKTRAFSRDGIYIAELPGSLSETKSIVKLFADNNKKALLKTHLQANEEFVKSGELSKYRYLHFATHGIVNEEKPELSGLILAQDTTSSEDNILFTGEIYNIKLNADLTVMSACETGLGKITEGEGVIGLTRALLYAGSKNIIVSLWQVSDASTNTLMVDFYKNFLNEKNPPLKGARGMSYTEHLRKAKLQMIKEGKYAHPFFWSPFILIGQ